MSEQRQVGGVLFGQERGRIHKLNSSTDVRLGEGQTGDIADILGLESKEQSSNVGDTGVGRTVVSIMEYSGKCLDKLWRVMQSHNPVITLNLTSDGWCRIENGDTDEVLGEGPKLFDAIANIEEKQTMTKTEHATVMERLLKLGEDEIAVQDSIEFRLHAPEDMLRALPMLKRAMELLDNCDETDASRWWKDQRDNLLREWNGECR